MDWFADIQPWVDFAAAQNPHRRGRRHRRAVGPAGRVRLDLAGPAPGGRGLARCCAPRSSDPLGSPGMSRAPPTVPTGRVRWAAADDELRPITHHPQLARPRRRVGARRVRRAPACCAPRPPPRACRAGARGSGLGWVTAEYAMLPASTNTRSDRESVKGRIGGRTHEISRLIGRSLRAVIDYKALGENTIVLDCDVLQADGGTRTAAITGAYVALADAVRTCVEQPARCRRAADRVGRGGQRRHHRRRAALDLPYEEDVRAETDMNVVMTGDGPFVEVQGTAEGRRSTGASSTPARPAEKGCADLDPPAAGGPRPVSPDPPSVPGHPQRQEARRDAADPRRAVPRHRGARPRRRDAVRRAGRRPSPTFEGNALLKARAGVAATGLPTSPTTAGCASTRSTACRACCRRAGPGADGAPTRNNGCCSTSSPTYPTSAAARHSPVPSRAATRRRGAGRPRRDARPDHPRGPGERRLRLRRAVRGRRRRRA